MLDNKWDDNMIPFSISPAIKKDLEFLVKQPRIS